MIVITPRFLLAVLFAFLSIHCTTNTTTIQEEAEDMQPGTPKNPLIVSPEPAVSDVGTTAIFTPGSGPQSIVRLRYREPRQVTLYVFWDPYKNNPQGVPSDQFQTVGNPLGANRRTFGALGRLKIGLQQTITEVNFDIPYQQLIAIPVVCDYCEITAKIIRAVYGNGDPPLADPTIQGFNDPADFATPAGDAYPNAQQAYPRGFVAITSAIGEGSIGGSKGGAAMTRRAYLGAMDPAGVSVVPIAFGATHLEVRGTDVLVTAVVAVDNFNGGGPQLFPLVVNSGVPAKLPLYAQFIQVTNSNAGEQSAEVIQYIGL